ncbi:Molybdenum cofactor guanylyltransferase [Zhongshania aliphaticivorans]|uniref:Molybdenum cofactor guanylyltransferase n=1 Tax=Zhongshania aliphaticivorans TaxID=1470434 RepID=A0A5S9QDE2_9GAMM|nr:nucleotidyltransferase family protein [Zhongshania aliphaticivorans]CAA0087856.1 Molybdenum cofactor guanylyltransferase [Zhongshania aliphaticivorans]CAA0115552.1 Molybdenum cofactor guanylyltransferase [Zhongshania aliphaticivorans]CAA0120255.1 Molybdenum cofactor guanylyltransferase [Zhongshania aliphaticivorans]
MFNGDALPVLILAAGKSRRFGSADKRFTKLPHGGVLINALIRRVRKAGLDAYVVIDPEDDVSALIDAPCLYAANAKRGMGASIADAVAMVMAQSAAPSLLLMPADLPLIRISSLRRVAARAVADKIIIPRYGEQRGHPVAFGRHFWCDLSQLSQDEGARSIIAAADEAGLDIVGLDDEGIILDADTPEQMQSLLQKLRPVLN